MTAYRITIGQRSDPRLQFEAMSESSCTAAAQHADLALPGERLDVEAIDREMLADKQRDGWFTRQCERAVCLERERGESNLYGAGW